MNTHDEYIFVINPHTGQLQKVNNPDYILEKIEETNNIKDVIEKAHEHSNKDILDEIDHLPIDGQNGTDGINGINGIDGQQGIQGEKGDKGDTGEQGIQGIQGEKGEDGLAGGGYLSKCRVYFDGDQIFGVYPTKVNFNNISYDINSEWDTVNKRFVAKEAGYYLITAQINYANFTNTGFLMCYYNYGLANQANLTMLADKDGYINLMDIRYLNVGDYIEIWGNVVGVNIHCWGGSSNTFFAIHRLS